MWISIFPTIIIYHFFSCETTVNNLGITHVLIHSLSTEGFYNESIHKLSTGSCALINRILLITCG